MSPDHPHGFDIHADERGRIIGSMVSIIVLTTLAVMLRFLSRKLARAGFWVWPHSLHIETCFTNLGRSLMKFWFAVGRFAMPLGFGEHPHLSPAWTRLMIVACLVNVSRDYALRYDFFYGQSHK